MKKNSVGATSFLFYHIYIEGYEWWKKTIKEQVSEEQVRAYLDWQNSRKNYLITINLSSAHCRDLLHGYLYGKPHKVTVIWYYEVPVVASELYCKPGTTVMCVCVDHISCCVCWSSVGATFLSFIIHLHRDEKNYQRTSIKEQFRAADLDKTKQ